MFKSRWFNRNTSIFFLRKLRKYKINENLKNGEIFQPNCSTKFICDNGEFEFEDLRPCATNAVCLPDEFFNLQCVCIQGFIGDGFICEKEITTTTERFEFSRKLKINIHLKKKLKIQINSFRFGIH